MMDPVETIIKIEDALGGLRLKVQRLKKQNEEFKESLEIQEPLVRVGVAIRRRFFEQAREIRGHRKALDSIIEAGNTAGHRGDYIADTAMLKMGYMKTKEKVLNAQGCLVPLEENHGTLYKELYSRKNIPVPSSEWVNLISLRLPIQSRINPQKAVELYNLTANITSCGPAYKLGQFDHDMEDLNRLGVLAVQFVGIYTAMERQINVLEDLFTAFDTSPEVEDKLREMKEIRGRIIRTYGVRHRR